MTQAGISLLEENSGVTVRLEGRARVETAVLLKQQLSQVIARDVAVDWGDAEHVDACVLQVLLALRKLLLERGLSFVVDKDNRKVREFLKLSGLEDCFPLRQP